jgi:transposase
MAAPMSMDLRERIARAVEAGGSRRSAARQFAVSASCAIKLMQRLERTGSLAPAAMGGKKPFALVAHADVVGALITAQPDITIDELKEKLAAAGIAVGRSSIGRFLVSLGLTRKKRRSMPASRIARTSPRRGRRGARPSPT